MKAYISAVLKTSSGIFSKKLFPVSQCRYLVMALSFRNSEKLNRKSAYSVTSRIAAISSHVPAPTGDLSIQDYHLLADVALEELQEMTETILNDNDDDSLDSDFSVSQMFLLPCTLNLHIYSYYINDHTNIHTYFNLKCDCSKES